MVSTYRRLLLISFKRMRGVSGISQKFFSKAQISETVVFGGKVATLSPAATLRIETLVEQGFQK